MPPALVCLSHLRWDFVYQRPNHLMVRAARDRRVFFVEEPVHGDGAPSLRMREWDGVIVVQPQLPEGLSESGRRVALESLMDDLVARERIADPWLWYYTPMALPWTRGLDAAAVVYDCMDELSGFRGAPPELVALERELFARADVVFTGGRSLYEAKARQHRNVHPFPSSVEVAHFAKARHPGPDPDDQAGIPRPRIGYYGVIDERIDRELITGIAELRPEWQIVLVGPVAKLQPDEVPTGPNIHHLGLKRYAELPEYLRGWDVAIMPFARNDATRYISPTKTPEYLAGGRPVVSTSIHDVVEPYGRLDLVRIADTATDFVEAVEAALADDMPTVLRRADSLLRDMSWDATWSRMDDFVRRAIEVREPVAAGRPDLVAEPAPLRLGTRPAGEPAGVGLGIGAARGDGRRVAPRDVRGGTRRNAVGQYAQPGRTMGRDD